MREQFSLRTVQKKAVMTSKIAGLFLIFSYMVSTKLPVSPEVSFLLWMAFVVLLVFIVDALLRRFISDPICEISEMAHKIAQLDFSASCKINSRDEFGELADSLHKMSENLQRALEKLEEDVRQERRLLKERKELADRLSHEMKTPLGVIRAYAEGVQDEKSEEKRQKYAGIIIGETDRMSALITTLLDLSALENGAASLEPKRFDFVEFTETIAGRLLCDVPDGDFELQYALPDHKVFVYSDPSRMEQVLNNLLVNARKNVSPNGVLKLSLVEEKNRLCFSVFNQGAPIPPEKLSKIWDKFYRDKNARYGGSGLGLAIVAQILSMQHLEYGVENRSDGVSFFFYIPIEK